MKRQKVIVAVMVVLALFIFSSIAYSDNGNHGKPFQRLEQEIRENEIEIQILQRRIRFLNSLISGLQAQIDDMQESIDALSDLEDVPQTLLEIQQEIEEMWDEIDYLWNELIEEPPSYMVYGWGEINYRDGIYLLEKGKIWNIGETEQGSYNLSIVFTSSGINLEEFSGMGDPEGAGDAIWISLCSPFEWLEQGTYDFEAPDEGPEGPQNPNYQNPFTFDDLWVVLGLGSETGAEHITISGTVTVSQLSQFDPITISFEVMVEDADETGTYPATGFFSYWPSF